MSASFTPAQREALARDRHIIVTANAGAGKTSVLTERFLQIVLDDGVDLAKVVAITFTTKAAAQMRARVGEKLREVIANSDGSQPPQRVMRATSVLRRISMARISTFHAFCGALLRTYADDAGLQADVRELLPRETSAMIAESITQTVRAWMEDADRRDRLMAVIDEAGVQGMQSLLHSLAASAERMFALSGWRSRMATPADIVQDREHVLLPLLKERIAHLVDRVVSTILDAGKPLNDKGMQLFAQLQSERDVLADTSPATMRSTCQSIKSILGGLLTKSGSLIVNMTTVKGSIAVLPKPTYEALIAQLGHTWSVDLETHQVLLTDTLLAMATDVQIRYSQLKRERNGLDFDDLILKSITLLQSRADVATDVRMSISHLMIDEFQDTNPVQYELVRCLIPDLVPSDVAPTASQDMPCPKLFIVGDGKQSIYGFRNADVRLFERAGDEIDAANARHGWRSGRIALQASFRMAPACAAAINAVCTEVLVRASEFDVAYDPIVCGRTTVPDGVGSFQIVLTNTAAEDEESALDAECSHVANVIARIVSDPAHALRVGKRADSARNAAPGDIAVLVRNAKGAASMATALRRRNVPCHVLAGSGFFARPEVADIRNLLRWSTDPADDLACMALLRSPLLRCTDSDLHHIVSSGHGTVWERACRAAALKDSPDRIKQATAMMQDFLLDVRVLPIPTFVRSALSRCQWHATVADSPRRDQQLANVEKLIELMNDASRQGRTAVRDVIQAITPTDNDNEADELYDIGGDSVRIMTIHASKGLDFPVVVVAGIHSKSGGNGPSILYSNQLGPTMQLAPKIPDTMPPYTLVGRGALLTHAANKWLQDAREVAEDRRLLYVALTRAEDHLLVSIPYSVKKDGDLGATDSIGKILRPYFHQQRPLQEVDEQGWRLSYSQDMYADQQETQQLMHVRVPAMLPDDTVTIVDPVCTSEHHDSAEAAQGVIDLSAPLVDCVSIDMVSATEVLAAALRSDEPSAATVDADVDDTRGAAYGTIVHYLLQHGARLQGTMPDGDLRSALTTRLASRDVSDVVRNTAVDEVMAVLHAPFIQSMTDALRQAALETSLTAVLDGVTMYGVMDVLLQHTDGCAEIWDWKTTSIRHAADITAAAAQYEEQMRVYAWLLLSSNPTAPYVRTRLIFTKGVGVADNWMVTQTWTRQDMDKVTSDLRVAIASITHRRARRAGLLPAHP